MKKKPIFEKRIFWDVDFDKIDYDAKAAFVIERVFERVDVEDIRNCRRYYGDQKIEEVIINTRFLPEHRMNLAAVIINKDITELRYFTLRHLKPTLYPY